MINFNALTKPPFSPIETNTFRFFKLFPDLPKSLTKLLARIIPILALIGGIINLLSLFSHPFLINPLRPLSLIISGILLLVAYKPLKQRQSLGITLLFWSSMTHGLINFVWHLSPSIVLTTALSLYFLYQIRPHYNHRS